MGLITVFEAIFPGRKGEQKLQCVDGNPIAKNFNKN